MYLNIEKLDELLELFFEKEADTIIFIATASEISQEIGQIRCSVLVTVRPAGYDAIIRLTDVVGTEDLPSEDWKGTDMNALYEKRKISVETLTRLTEKRVEELKKKIEDKGFSVYHGAWVP